MMKDILLKIAQAMEDPEIHTTSFIHVLPHNIPSFELDRELQLWVAQAIKEKLHATD